MDLVGQRFDRLVVERFVDRVTGGLRWLCRCDCGGEVIKHGSQLRRVTRTGCRACEHISRCAVHLRHGGAAAGQSRLYRIWKAMRTRCTNDRQAAWKYYGGKGITICAEWQDFGTFRTWALAHGYEDRAGATRGASLTIERKNHDGPYSPENCEWLTGSENSRRMMARRRVA